jgi:lysophospholipase L1-like esterase
MRRLLISFCAFTQVFLSFQELNAQEESSKIFESGNIICFLGDSITHGGQYHEFLQLFYATRYPNLKLTFHNCGISGDNAEGMIYRLDKDVFIHKPSHVFLMTGMNDVIRTLYFEGEASNEIVQNRKKALDEYKRNIDILDKKFETSDIRPLYLTPSIYDQYSKIERENNRGCNDALIECSTHLKKIAKQRNTTVIDLNSSMKHIMERELQNDSLFTIVGKDRVHPETTGHFVMFHEILSTIESPSVIAQISIDLNQNNFIKTKNCIVENFQVSSDDISFSC